MCGFQLSTFIQIKAIHFVKVKIMQMGEVRGFTLQETLSKPAIKVDASLVLD